MEIRSTPFGMRHVMSRDFRKLLERIANAQRAHMADADYIRECLEITVAIWLPKSSRQDTSLLSLVESPEQINEFIAANRKVIDAAIKGLVD